MASPASSYSAQVAMFSKSSKAAVAVQMILLVVATATISMRASPTWDEFPHLAAGISHLRSGNFTLYRVNPPLVRCVAAIPIVLSTNHAVDPHSFDNDPYARPEFTAGLQLAKEMGAKSSLYCTFARWACLPFTIAAAMLVCFWSKKAYGPQAAFIGLLLYCWCPTCVTWGATVMPDLGAAATGCAAAFAFWRWWTAPTWRRCVVVGFLTGIALLTKATWIILLPNWAVLTLGEVVVRWTNRRRASRPWPALVVTQAAQFACLVAVALYIVNLGYGFEKTCVPLRDFSFKSESLGGSRAHEQPGNRFEKGWLGCVPVLVPANFLLGIDAQKYEFERQNNSYMHGKWKSGGWWYYYLYACAVKWPISTLVLSLLAFIKTIVDCRYRKDIKLELVLLSLTACVFLLASSQTGINSHYRYVLPAIPLLYVWVSKCGLVFQQKSIVLKAVVTGCIAWNVVSVMSVYPYVWSYVNEAAGGPRNGWRHLNDSSIDWGQDLAELKSWYDAHADARPFHVAYFGCQGPSDVGIVCEEVPIARRPGAGNFVAAGDLWPRPGWHAVSVSYLAGYREDLRDPPGYTYFQQFQPIAFSGYSIRIYHLDLDQVNDFRKKLGLPELSQ